MRGEPTRRPRAARSAASRSRPGRCSSGPVSSRRTSQGPSPPVVRRRREGLFPERRPVARSRLSRRSSLPRPSSRLHPVALALEGVGRQRDAPARRPGVEASPVHRHAGEPELAQGARGGRRRSSSPASGAAGRRRAPSARLARRGWRRASELRALPGPTSRSTASLRSKSVSRPAAKRTVRRRWRPQYSGSVASPGGDPGAGEVRDERDRRRVAGAGRRRRRRRRASAGSIIAEWKAWRGVQPPAVDPLARRARPRDRADRLGGPGDDAERGAVDGGERQPCAAAAAAAPPATAAPTAWRRAAAPASGGRAPRPGAAPSSSEKTPARQAATYSPTLWPIIAAGRTPHSIQSRASAYSTAKSAGCASAVCCEPLGGLRPRGRRG